MKISYNTRKNRSAPYDIIRREIIDGIELDQKLAETILNRKDSRKKLDDKFVLRRDLLGLYILTKDKVWIAVTHIDLTDSVRQNILRGMFDRDKITGLYSKSTGRSNINRGFSLSRAIISKYSLNEIDLIKKAAEEVHKTFEVTKSFPCSFCFDVILNGEAQKFRASKKSPFKNTKISLVS